MEAPRGVGLALYALVQLLYNRVWLRSMDLEWGFSGQLICRQHCCEHFAAKKIILGSIERRGRDDIEDEYDRLPA